MQAKQAKRPVLTWVGLYFIRWMEALGQCPSLVQDPGLHAFPYLTRRPRETPAPPRAGPRAGSCPGGTLCDDPHLSLGVSS